MEIIRDLNQAHNERPLVLTIGTFDGVHRGHQHLARQIVERADALGGTSAVLTFDPHPRTVLAPDKITHILSTPEERAQRLAGLGVGLFVVLPFTHEVAALSAEEFLRRVKGHLCLRELWVGQGFALGRGRQGDVSSLAALAEALDFELHMVQPLLDAGAPISSTRIRRAIHEGQMDEASRLLGRHYALDAVVVSGAQRGRNLGFRTANMRLPAERVLPGHGVYAVWAVLGQERFQGVANVGIRPSFDAGEVLIEVHLLDFDRDIYGQTLSVAFVSRLRPELRFADITALIAQMQQDVAQARLVLDQDAREPAYDFPVVSPLSGAGPHG
jgi:riboflavin kinase/FMN adenylyltransferase